MSGNFSLGRQCDRNEPCLAWWALTGSNRRHLPCKGSALPTELSAPRHGGSAPHAIWRGAGQEQAARASGSPRASSTSTAARLISGSLRALTCGPSRSAKRMNVAWSPASIAAHACSISFSSSGCQTATRLPSHSSPMAFDGLVNRRRQFRRRRRSVAGRGHADRLRALDRHRQHRLEPLSRLQRLDQRGGVPVGAAGSVGAAARKRGAGSDEGKGELHDEGVSAAPLTAPLKSGSARCFTSLIQ